MIYDGNWAIAQCERLGLTVNWSLRKISHPKAVCYWTWGCADCDTMIEAVIEAVAYIEERKL
jgi:hypothetical protein|uniref:Oxidoreductase n=1 Tax=Myoviridae sp. ctshb19 TaxID=2825194 RepID=A0A8S5UG51_9CAUD|nr:MAG TPA: oxidoreductase [Myoviridae sp. ctshb19]